MEQLQTENSAAVGQSALNVELGWQPIETAPYATNVLAWLYLPRNPIASGPVIASRSCVDKDEPENYGVFKLNVGCWWANDRYYHAGGDTGYMTYWMPLPAPPNV